jgi:uncharacterized OB-fold protein
VTGPVGVPPAVTEETEAFWAAAAEGRLVVDRCDTCGAYAFPPRGMCRHCHGRAFSVVEITGRGRIYSYTVNYQRWMPDLEVPFPIVLVEFPAFPGVRIVGRLRGCEPGEISIGGEVEVGFEPGPGGFSVPSFVAVAEAEP